MVAKEGDRSMTDEWCPDRQWAAWPPCGAGVSWQLKTGEWGGRWVGPRPQYRTAGFERVQTSQTCSKYLIWI
jgi:hypothetical protein